MAVLAFYSDRHGQIEHVESQCNWHGLTPSREVWPTACRCCAAPAADGGVISIACFDTLCKVVVVLRGAFFVDAARQKARCRGAQCAPVGVWSVRGHSPKVDAAQGWRANDVRPYMLYSTKN